LKINGKQDKEHLRDRYFAILITVFAIKHRHCIAEEWNSKNRLNIFCLALRNDEM